MHSDLEQKERDEIMLGFKNRRISILIATDIVSRGIDIDDIQLVINYDVPRDPEDYVHRIGRTARANREGQAVTLVTPRDWHHLLKIEKLIENKELRINMGLFAKQTAQQYLMERIASLWKNLFES